MIALWSAQQHAWLQALGHQVLVQGALPEAPSAVTEAAAPARSRPAPGPSRLPTAPPVARDRGAIAAAPAATRPAVRLPDRLHFALIRASGCNPNAPEAAQLIAQWPTAAQLRGNPAAKRALWPRLRALRGNAPP